MRTLDFPPLLTGIAVPGDPFEAALASVAEDVEPGAVFYGLDDAVCRAAVVLAPEVPLGEAMAVVFAPALGLNDALGALAPPEVGFHIVWPDRFRVNGGLCGTLRAAASTLSPDEEPDWLIVGIEVPVLPRGTVEPGLTPDETCLHEEGCGDVTAEDLIETWARHMMNWLHIYLTEGFEPLHREWRGKAHGVGGEVDYPESGTFLGLDEWGGMILKDGAGTRVLPLTSILERP